ncbi:hypothetical protein ZIOFF_069426 [Zingiber officinale]|uniref:Bulb-type lectin domain-containing protein n=1 Tax=Zingiber officinale TaxID=94328 RepID=A0A8J5CVW5_ZINOF|nr:hypothetical protein ZIOFF_069426 [Zingiber officinale]
MQLSIAAIALQLLPSGELCLLNAANASLWSSFNYPTDMLLPSKLLPISSSHTSSANENDLTLIDYRLLITTDNSVLDLSPRRRPEDYRFRDNLAPAGFVLLQWVPRGKAG